MRKGELAAAVLAVAAMLGWNSGSARAMAISAPAALKVAGAELAHATTVHCWDCGYDEPRRYYRPYYRSYYRPYYRPAYRPYYRPYYRSYYSSYRPYYRPYHRPYGYGYYHAPRPRFYVGPTVYWY